MADCSELILGRLKKAPTIKEMMDVVNQISDSNEWTLSLQQNIVKQATWDKMLRNPNLAS